jgi:hypothetical protein
MLGPRVQIELEVPHGVAAIGEKGNLLVELVTLGLEHFEQASFGFLVISLDEGKAFAGDRLLGLLTPRERQETFAGDDFEPALRALGPDIAPIDAHRERAIGDGQAAPLRRTAVDERPLFLPQRLLQPFGDGEHMLANGAGGEGVIDWQHLL